MYYVTRFLGNVKVLVMGVAYKYASVFVCLYVGMCKCTLAYDFVVHLCDMCVNTCPYLF